MKIMSIDPGSKYIGLAFYDSDKELYKTYEFTDGDYNTVWQFVMKGNWDYVIVEDFNAKFISRYGITTVRIVGGVEAICLVKEITLNRPDAQKRLPYCYAADQLLIKIHGKLPPRDHQQSALAHLLRFQEAMLGMKVR